MQTIVAYIKRRAGTRPAILDQRMNEVFQALGNQRALLFQNAAIEVLKQNSTSNFLFEIITGKVNELRTYPGLTALTKKRGLPQPAPFSHPEVPALDYVIVIDLPDAPSEDQKNIVREIRSRLDDVSEFSAGLCRLHMIFDRGTGSPKDQRIAFLVPWNPAIDHAESQRVWLEHHGPYAAQLISRHKHPEFIKAYLQLHTDLDQDESVFDSKYQGICFEHVGTTWQLLTCELFDSNVQKTNEALAIDEQSFCQGPSMIFLEKFRSL